MSLGQLLVPVGSQPYLGQRALLGQNIGSVEHCLFLQGLSGWGKAERAEEKGGKG